MDEGKSVSAIELSVLAEAGFRIASYPGLVRYTLVRAVSENLAHLARHQSTRDIRDRMASAQEYFAAVDLDRFSIWRKTCYSRSAEHESASLRAALAALG